MKRLQVRETLISFLFHSFFDIVNLLEPNQNMQVNCKEVVFICLFHEYTTLILI